MGTYEVRDDAGFIQETLELSSREARELGEQLPEGWVVARIDDDDEPVWTSE